MKYIPVHHELRTMRHRCNIPLIFIVNIVAVIICQDIYFETTTETHLSCRFPNGIKGICTSLDGCSSALEGLKKNVSPQICNYNAALPEVCCDFAANLPFSKSEQKCHEYHGPPRKPGQIVSCGQGGYNSPAKIYRHMAALGFGDESDIKWYCGGSLISYNFVLTAHCLYSAELGEVKFVRLGDLNLKLDTDDAEPQNFKIIRRIQHPKYKPPSTYHDIALVELDRPVNITDYVKPACIQNTKKTYSIGVVATGWGKIGHDAVEGADHLQVLELKEYTIDECAKYYPPNKRRLANGILDDLQICAREKTIDTCQGDSGGPLQVALPDCTKRGHRIVGITSFGKICGITEAPGVYTRVSNYQEWIESVVWPN